MLYIFINNNISMYVNVWREFAEFSSNLPQHTSLEVSSLPSKNLIS